MADLNKTPISKKNFELLFLCNEILNFLPNSFLSPSPRTELKVSTTRDLAAKIEDFLINLGTEEQPLNPWNESTAFDALCLWEEILENPEKYPLVTEFREDEGICTTRQRVLGWVDPLNKIFKAAQEEGWDSPFDFEFIPLFLEHCTTASNTTGICDLCLTIPPECYNQMGAYLALLDKVEGVRTQTLQSIRKINGTGEGPAFSPADIKRSVGL